MHINSIPGPVFGSSAGCRYRENIFSLVNRRTPSGEKNMFCLGSCWALQLAQLHDAQRPVDIRDDTNFPNLKMRLKVLAMRANCFLLSIYKAYQGKLCTIHVYKLKKQLPLKIGSLSTIDLCNFYIFRYYETLKLGILLKKTSL